MVAMLHLQYSTPPGWASVALAAPEALLQDHRACEAKAAAMAAAIARKHGSRAPSIRPLMAALAAEEEQHTALCDGLLAERGAHPGPPPPNLYVRDLRARVHATRGFSPLDQLLIAGTIEARSAERFRLLADAAAGSALGRFYEDLFASEARHHALFVNLAVDLAGEARALERLHAITAIEAEVVAALPWGPRIH